MNKLIENENISLRLLTEQDKKLLLKWLTDERVLNYWEGKTAVFDLKRIEEDFYCEEEGLIRTIIEYQGQAIGYCQMYSLDKESMKEYNYKSTKKVVYGIDQFIGEPDCWGKGIGTNFMKLVINYLFDEKGANAVILDPHADNPRAIRCYEKVGFKIVKSLPKHELHDGEMVDCYLMEYTK